MNVSKLFTKLYKQLSHVPGFIDYARQQLSVYYSACIIYLQKKQEMGGGHSKLCIDYTSCSHSIASNPARAKEMDCT